MSIPDLRAVKRHIDTVKDPNTKEALQVLYEWTRAVVSGARQAPVDTGSDKDEELDRKLKEFRTLFLAKYNSLFDELDKLKSSLSDELQQVKDSLAFLYNETDKLSESAQNTEDHISSFDEKVSYHVTNMISNSRKELVDQLDAINSTLATLEEASVEHEVARHRLEEEVSKHAATEDIYPRLDDALSKLDNMESVVDETAATLNSVVEDLNSLAIAFARTNFSRKVR